MIIVRADSAYHVGEAIAAIRRGGARFSVTVPNNSKVAAAIAGIGEDAWTAIEYPRALWDDQLGCWVSEAEVAETEYTAFDQAKDNTVTARLIVRRVRDQNKVPCGGTNCSRSWRAPRSPFPSPAHTSRWARAATIRPGLIAVGVPQRLLGSAATWSCTSRRAGTANANGSTSGKPPADHPPKRPDQPRPGPHPSRPKGHPEPRPPSPRTCGQAAENASGGKPTPENSPATRNLNCAADKMSTRLLQA